MPFGTKTVSSRLIRSTSTMRRWSSRETATKALLPRAISSRSRNRLSGSPSNDHPCSCVITTGTAARRPITTPHTLAPNLCAWTTSTRSSRRSLTSGRQAHSSTRERRSRPRKRTPAPSRRSTAWATVGRSLSLSENRVAQTMLSKRSESRRSAICIVRCSAPPCVPTRSVSCRTFSLRRRVGAGDRRAHVEVRGRPALPYIVTDAPVGSHSNVRVARLLSDKLVLCYHAVSPSWPADLSITPERLEASSSCSSGADTRARRSPRR